MSEMEYKLMESLTKIDEIRKDMTEVKVTLARNTESLEHHVARTDQLQEMVTPVYQDFIAKKAVKEYKEEWRKDFVYKLKLPGYILAAMASAGAIWAWFSAGK